MKTRVLCSVLLAGSAAWGEVTTDGSLGARATFGGGAFEIPSGLGKKVGGNLFHSFERFDLAHGDAATFSGPAEVQNIFSRVTGGQRSSIDGLLRSTIEGANFFLLNPNGVIFGPNAAVEVSGAFAVVTGSHLALSDGARFEAVPGAADALLTSAPAAAFGFLPGAAGEIAISGSQLTGAEGKPWALVGGNVRLDSNAALNVSGLVIRGGRLTMDHAKIAVAAKKSGDRADVHLREAIEMTNESAIAVTTSADFTNTVVADLAATGALTVREGSTVRTGTTGAGAGGDILVRAGSVSLVGAEELLTSLFTDTEGSGRAGNIRLEVAGTVAVEANAKISSDNTFGSGAGGQVEIAARDIRVDGKGLAAFTGISAETHDAIRGGPGGNIRLKVSGTLALLGGGAITASTLGPGAGGDVDISAARVFLSDPGTGINARTESEVLAGRGGAIRLRISGRLDLVDGAAITASSFGPGAGGSIAIDAGAVSLARDGSISAVTFGYFGGGKGGDIAIRSPLLEARTGGYLSASTDGSGAGGSIAIDARRIVLDGATTGLFAGATAPAEAGRPASVSGLTVQLEIAESFAEHLTVRLTSPDGARITLFSGVGGSGQNFSGTVLDDRTPTSIRDGQADFRGTFRPEEPLSAFDGRAFNNPVVPWKLEISNPNLADTTTLLSWSLTSGGVTRTNDEPVSLPGPRMSGNATSELLIGDLDASFERITPGRGGSIRLRADAVDLLHGAEISASTRNSGAGGDVRLDVSGALQVASGSLIAARTDASGAGGNVSVGAGKLFVTGGGSLSADTDGSGRGGNVSVKAGSVSIAGTASKISAESTHPGPGGRGGDILVDAGALRLADGAAISARSLGQGASGTVWLKAGALALRSGAVVASSNTGAGHAGSVVIRSAGGVRLEGASAITTAAERADAGNIDILAGTRIELFGGSAITASAGANGGSILLRTRDTLHLRDSQLTATAGTSLSASGSGTGGNITIDPDFIILEDATISANAAIGQGGNILLITPHFLSSGSLLTATGSTAGTVEIAAPELDLTSALARLTYSVLDASSLLREQCARRLGEDFSSFLLLGRGGVETTPDEPAAAPVRAAKKKAPPNAKRGEAGVP